MTDVYCVFGNPIEHSKSPQIHAAFAEQTGQDIQYMKQLVDEGKFNEAAEAFFMEEGKGLNVTVPFKLDAYNFADELTDRARLAGAVNTLALQENGKILGDNTDGVGLVTDIVDRLGWRIKEKKVLVVGAGGAARGVIGPLLAQKPSLLVVVNRTAEKAAALADIFAQEGSILGGGYQLMEDHSFDLVINGTSASLYGELPPLPPNSFADDCAAYDMVYSSNPTPFMALAERFGVKRIADGLGMLVGQAAESFYLWRGVTPKVEPVITKLKLTT